MTNIVSQCIAWNAARYDRVLDLKLALSLLAEETDELFAADNIVDRLDAIGDINFVSIGIMWKAGLSEEEILTILGLFDVNGLFHENISTCDTAMLHFSFAGFVHEVAQDSTLDTTEKVIAFNAAILAIWHSAFVLRSIGLQQEYFNIVKAICDSNDTKEVKGKTDPLVKANIVKGNSFVPPTAALKQILASYELATVVH